MIQSVIACADHSRSPGSRSRGCRSLQKHCGTQAADRVGLPDELIHHPFGPRTNRSGALCAPASGSWIVTPRVVHRTTAQPESTTLFHAAAYHRTPVCHGEQAHLPEGRLQAGRRIQRGGFELYGNEVLMLIMRSACCRTRWNQGSSAIERTGSRVSWRSNWPGMHAA